MLLIVKTVSEIKIYTQLSIKKRNLRQLRSLLSGSDPCYPDPFLVVWIRLKKNFRSAAFHLNKANIVGVGLVVQEQLDGLRVVSTDGPVQGVHALVVLVVDGGPAVQEEGEYLQVAAIAGHHQRAPSIPAHQEQQH